MKEVVILENCKYVFLGVVVLWAVITDLKYEKITNNIIIAGLIGVLVNLLLNFSIQKAVFSGAGILFPILCLFPLFYFHMFGAGDIKLLAVTGGLLGCRGVLFCLIVSIFAAAVISVYKMCRYQLFQERFAYFSHYMKIYLKTRKRVPYYNSDLSGYAKLHFSVPVAISVAVYFLAIWG